MILLRKVTALWMGRRDVWHLQRLKTLRRFLADCSGATAVMMALALPVMVLGMGIGAETGYQYMTQRKLQHAADLSAHAGAARLRAGDTETAITAAATHVAVQTGFRAETGTIEVNTPPLSGIAAGEAQSVEVILNQIEPRYFSLLISNEPVVITARAVARVITTGSTACVLALAPTAPGAITVSGSTSVGLNGCDIASNSNAADALLMSGTSAELFADCAHTVGRAVVNSRLQLSDCPTVHELAPVVRDPYADVPEPALVGTCRSRNQGSPNTTTTLTPSDTHPSGVNSMRFCSGLSVKGDIIFEPGLYIIESGDFSINSGDIESSGAAALAADGVTFFLTGTARLVLGGNAELTLAAPSTGPYAGLIFFASRSQTGITHRLAGTSGSTVHGAVYVPESAVELTGNSRASGGCTQIIAQRITFTGNSTLRSNCTTSNAGTREILTNEAIAIVE